MKDIVNIIINNLIVYKIILFGSQVSVKSENDVDLIIISDDFCGLSRMKRIKLILSLFTDVVIDPICLTNTEYDNYKNGIFFETILKNSKVLYDREN
jgi:predicted nucleotidyltransferase